jgi:hypothetical protein
MNTTTQLFDPAKAAAVTETAQAIMTLTMHYVGELDALGAHNYKLQKENQELSARLVAAEADARRYEWLRDQYWVQDELVYRLGLGSTVMHDAQLYDTEVAAAIDRKLGVKND